MLMFLGIVAALLAVGLFVLTVFANAMSDAPDIPGVPLWPAFALAAVALLLFVLRHYLHGTSITW